MDAGIDTGPIIIQKQVPVLEGDDEDLLSARILKEEHLAYSEAINLHIQKRLKIVDRRVITSPPKRFNPR